VPNIWFIAISPWNKQYMKVAILHSGTATCIIQSPRLLALRVVDPILLNRLSFHCQHCILRKLRTWDTENICYTCPRASLLHSWLPVYCSFEQMSLLSCCSCSCCCFDRKSLIFLRGRKMWWTSKYNNNAKANRTLQWSRHINDYKRVQVNDYNVAVRRSTQPFWIYRV
jgi:hypothetical protein